MGEGIRFNKITDVLFVETIISVGRKVVRGIKMTLRHRWIHVIAYRGKAFLVIHASGMN